MFLWEAIWVHFLIHYTIRALPPPPLQHATAKRKKEVKKKNKTPNKRGWLPCHIQQFVLAQMLHSSFFFFLFPVYSHHADRQARDTRPLSGREQSKLWKTVQVDDWKMVESCLLHSPIPGLLLTVAFKRISCFEHAVWNFCRPLVALKAITNIQTTGFNLNFSCCLACSLWHHML